MENKDKLYAIEYIDGGSIFLKRTLAFRKMLINEVSEDISRLIRHNSYVDLKLVVSKLDVLLSDMDSDYLSDVTIYIAKEYGFGI